MSILYDEGQQAIATETRRVLEARIGTDDLLPLLETTGVYHAGFWTTAKEQGWMALALPEAYGGLDLGLSELGLIAHQAGRSLSGAPFLTTGFGAARAIERHGSDAQKARWLPGLASGEIIGAVALASGPDALPAQPDVRYGNGALNGTARGVCGGTAADVAIVYAAGEDGPLLAVADLSGATRSAIASFDNSRCTADISFAATPAERLDTDGDARGAALGLLALQAVVAAHEQTGGA